MNKYLTNYMVAQFVSTVLCVIITLIAHLCIVGIDHVVGTTRWHIVLLLALVVALLHAKMYGKITQWLEVFDDHEE